MAVAKGGMEAEDEDDDDRREGEEEGDAELLDVSY